MSKGKAKPKTKLKVNPKSLTRKILLALGIPTVFIPGLILASVLGWNWQTDLAQLKERGGYYQSKTIFPKTATVTEVIDGDTIELDSGQTIRLLGINAPNRGEKGYQKAKEYLTDLIDTEEIFLEYDSYQDDKYGRLLAYVFEKCSTSLGCKNGKRLINWLLINKGYAEITIYKDRGKLKYQDILLD